MLATLSTLIQWVDLTSYAEIQNAAI